MNFHEKVIDDFNQFYEYVSNEVTIGGKKLRLKSNDWIFRGHADGNWKLEPSIIRALHTLGLGNKPYSDLLKREKDNLESFSRDAHREFKFEIPKSVAGSIDDKLTMLSHMQHYGAPTRLLDFTVSPYFAAFFALEPFEYNKRPSVIGINYKALVKYDKRRLGRKYDEKLFLENKPEEDFVYYWKPPYNNPRLSAQNGCFLIPSNFRRSVGEILKSNYDIDETIGIKFTFNMNKMKCRGALRNLQNTLGISYHSLFPDNEGLCRSLRVQLIL